MRNYIIRRLLLNMPVLFIVITMVFSVMRLAPGDVVEVMLETSSINDAGLHKKLYDQIRKELGLDKPIYVQFAQYIFNVFRGDLGISIWTRLPVLSQILVRLPVTIELGIMTIVLSTVMALPVGIIAAIRQDTWVDYVTRVLSILALSVPSFWTATLVIMYPSIWWGYGPPIEYKAPWEDLGVNLRMLLPPALIAAAVGMGSVSRMTRSALLEVIRQDYIRTAWSKGLGERVVLWRHALKNAMIPVITLMGLQFGAVIGGSVVMETIFALPGVGKLVVNAAQTKDFPQLQGNVLFIASWVLVITVIIDVTYAWLDPRIRYR